MAEKMHTPTPWVASGRYIGTRNHLSSVGECRDVNGNWCDDVKSSADAAFIVLSVNSHDKLVEALKALLKIIEDAREDEALDATTCDAGGIIFGDIASEAIEAARAALASLDQEPGQ